MWKIIEQFLILIQFMTRIPVFIKTEYSNEKLGKSIKFFPLLGLIVGLILFGASIIFCKLVGMEPLQRQIVALLIILVEIFVVGIIHLDGLADTFDALFSYATKDKMLEIMKDSRVGTNGAVVLILYFIAKILLISEILAIDGRYLIIYPILARLSTSMNAGLGEYARKTGMSNGIIDENGLKEAIFSIILVVLVKGVKGIIITVIAILFILFFRRNVRKKIDGITGDTMGASLELVNLIVLMAGIILK